MRVELTGERTSLLKKSFVSKSARFIERALFERGVVLPVKNPLLVIALLGEKAMTNLNRDFRGKDKVTDILSFEPLEEGCLGEIALCISRVKTQAAEHGLSFREEAVYLILHGILHLSGYTHEEGGEKAAEMYRIQDDVFEEWQTEVLQN